MNGYELYERVRKNPRWVAIPFILLTARAMELERSSNAAGMYSNAQFCYDRATSQSQISIAVQWSRSQNRLV